MTREFDATICERAWRAYGSDRERTVASIAYATLEVNLNRLGLKVKTSEIPGAGKGLFCARAEGFRKGDVICEYRGEIMRTARAIRKADKAYLMRIGPQCYVDASLRIDVRTAFLRNDYYG